MITQLSKQDVIGRWPELARRFKRCCPDNLLPAAIDGRLHVLEHHQGAIVAIQYNDSQCEVTALEGRGMADWLGEIIAVVTAAARARGIKEITSVGRRGWLRVIPGAVQRKHDILLRAL